MNAQELLSKAMDLHQEGEIEEADGIYEALLTKNNEHPELLFLSSSTSWMLGRPEASYGRLKKAIHIDPDHRYYALLGNVCQSLGEYEEAVRQYRFACTHGNTEADTHTNMGLALFELGQCKEAKKAHNQSLILDPEHLGACYNLALIFLFEKDYTKAQEYLIRAREIDPEDIEVLNNLGNTYLHQGQIQQARSLYAQALSHNQYYGEALYNMAMSYQSTGENIEVKRRLQMLLEIHPKHLRGMRTLADIMITDHDYYSAEQLLHMATQLAPSHVPTWSSLADTLVQQDQYSAAITVIEQTLALEETSYSWVQLGVVQKELQSQKELDISTEDIAHSFRRALELEPTSGKARYILDMIEGRTPDRAPLDYVENLFNFYAPKFEEHLVDILEYKTPQQLKDFLWESQTTREFPNILDLGCGTGLMGMLLHEHSKTLIGVDISSLMLQKAAEKKIYTTLHQDDIFAVFTHNMPRYELIVAADVLVYIGDLQPLFSLLPPQMTKGALFLFSIEECPEGFFLGPEARFLHSVSHIQESLPSSMSIISTKEAPLRKNNDTWVKGLLILIQYNP
jgi:predicted TPR repeat methyltransferase/Tfp pilus assembly protein PilF